MRISDWSSDVCSSDLLATGQLRRMAEAEALQMRYLQGPLLRAQGAFGDMTKGVGAGIAKRGGVGQGTNTERIEDQQHGTGHRGFRSNKGEIGRASCGERGGQYVEIAGVAVTLKK